MKLARGIEVLRFYSARLGERLWIKPLLLGLLSVAAIFLARFADDQEVSAWLPDIRPEVLDSLLTIMASSMLVIATFALSSMVSAYASASTTASPRSFAVVIADDISQSALSTFIGAFIFSIVSLIAFKSDFYGEGGRFVLFVLTVGVFAAVVLVFVYWTDRIARLGLMTNTIHKVEAATTEALQRRRIHPCLNGRQKVEDGDGDEQGEPVRCEDIGYLQRIDMHALQDCAEELQAEIHVLVLPGSFITPERTVARLQCQTGIGKDMQSKISSAFTIGSERTFDDDPRYGMVVLSQIADRALSPGINDPGTAIDILGVMVRLLHQWQQPLSEEELACRDEAETCERVFLPVLSMADMFDDAFTAIARDGAAFVEVGVRLQKSLADLAQAGDDDMKASAVRHSRRALLLAKSALPLEDELAQLEQHAPEGAA